MRAYLFQFFLICFSIHCSAQSDSFALINSAYDEQLPVLSPDHKTLYFTRVKHPGNSGGISDPGDIWFSELQEDGQWSAPKNARDLNNRGYNGVIGFTIDSRTIYLLNHYNKDESRAGTQGISRSVLRGGSWSHPENISLPYFINKSQNHGAYISPDGQVLMFSIEAYGTQGGEDIYVSLNEGNGKWSEPKNLGTTINTSAQEFTPFLSADKTTLYFSSNGHGGLGSSDILMSKRLDESWKNWSSPVPMQFVNSEGRDLAYRAYDGFALFTSTINSDGYSDIRMYSEQPEKQIEPQVVDVPDSVIEDMQATVAIEAPVIYGTIKNADNREPVSEVTLRLSAGDRNETLKVDPVTGTFSMPIISEGSYELSIDAPGYISTNETVLVEGNREEPAIERNILLQPVVVGKTIQLPNVLFKRSSPDILPESNSELDRVVDFLRANPDVHILLGGHTDNTGVPKHNLRLSKARVESVEDYLVAQGINQRRISGKGYGGTMPIADNTNEDTRRLNRRVEFTIVKN